MGFWHIYFGIYGGGEAVVVAINMQDGWVASPINRVSVAASLSRVSVAKAQGK